VGGAPAVAEAAGGCADACARRRRREQRAAGISRRTAHGPRAGGPGGWTRGASRRRGRVGGEVKVGVDSSAGPRLGAAAGGHGGPKLRGARAVRVQGSGGAAGDDAGTPRVVSRVSAPKRETSFRVGGRGPEAARAPGRDRRYGPPSTESEHGCPPQTSPNLAPGGCSREICFADRRRVLEEECAGLPDRRGVLSVAARACSNSLTSATHRPMSKTTKAVFKVVERQRARLRARMGDSPASGRGRGSGLARLGTDGARLGLGRHVGTWCSRKTSRFGTW